MEFTFETQYNAKTMSLMAKALRKTIRKKRSRCSHIFGWIFTILGLFLIIKGFAFDFRTIILSIAVLLLLVDLLFEDKINGYVAKKHLLPGTEKAVTAFSENGFVSTTDAGKSEWNYDKIEQIAETEDFFVFIFNEAHAQLYDKRQLQGGTVEEFRDFIQRKTGKSVERI